MLTIQMPDGHKNKERRRTIRAIGYMISGLTIMTMLFIAYSSNLWYAVVALEAWWLWATLTDPGLKQ